VGKTEIRATRDRQLIRREGEYWTVVFDGVTCRLRDGRGVHHLAYLLRHPRDEVAALVLERRGEGNVRSGMSIGARVAPHDARERARVNVTRAISTVLRRIAAHHPALAEHLEATIKTGTFCSYTPDPRIPVRWTE
jgi:hypothetical protein